MRSVFVSVLLIAALGLSACGSESCSGDVTEGTLKKLVAQRLHYPPDYSKFSASFSDIVTNNANGKTLCQASVHVEADGGALKEDHRIAYQVETTDDGKIYVTLYAME